MSVLTLEAKLERTDSTTPWGFRMQGGKDFSSPLTIQKVNPGSLASKCGLQQGDIILKIGNIGTETLRHKEAQESIIASGNRLDLLLQRIREKKKIIQDGGGSPSTPILQSYETFSQPSYNASSLQNQPPTPSQQTFNAAPRPFGASAVSAPTPFKPSYGKDDLVQRTSNLSISPGSETVDPLLVALSPLSSSSSTNISTSSSTSAPPVVTSSTRTAIAEKYSEEDSDTKPSQHQSKSFKYLKDLMDSGKEPPKALKPSTNKALQPRSLSPVEAAPSSQVKANKPGTVKAIMSQRYNTPIGLYSDSEVMNQFEGQSKFLLSTENGGDDDDDLPPPPPPEMMQPEEDNTSPVKYFPSETFRMIQEQEKGPGDDGLDKTAHSRSFLKLQKQLDSSGAPPAPQFNPKPVPAPTSTFPKPAAAPAAKPWTPAVPPALSGPRPVGSGVAPKPTGLGAKRGRLGDAVVSTPVAGTQNRIPVCSGCGSPIRGPFVTALGNCWCPDHFVCANPQCGIKLIDIGFVEEGGYLYCERDYERYLAPHCKKCSNSIIGECVNALQSTWHPECFICAQCKQPIGGNQFHVEDGKPYCEKDWAAMFQTMCAGCDFPIEPGDRWVEALGKNFHAGCFNCSTCQISLEGQPFVAKAGKAFCKKHAR